MLADADRKPRQLFAPHLSLSLADMRRQQGVGGETACALTARYVQVTRPQFQQSEERAENLILHAAVTNQRCLHRLLLDIPASCIVPLVGLTFSCTTQRASSHVPTNDATSQTRKRVRVRVRVCARVRASARSLSPYDHAAASRAARWRRRRRRRTRHSAAYASTFLPPSRPGTSASPP
eukprot:4761511-Pleurochrysis_carterae.AAC.2